MIYLNLFPRKSVFRSFICLTATTAILLLSYSALKTSNRIYAAPPGIARITHVNNLDLPEKITVYPDGPGSKGEDAENWKKPSTKYNTLGKASAALGIPIKESTAKLSFYNGDNFTNYIANLGPNPQAETTYSYPCFSGLGAATFGWNIHASSSTGAGCTNLILKSRRSSSAGAITVSPQRELTLIHANDDKGYLVVDVLLGAIRVKSASNPTGRVVAAGNQYIELPNGRSRVQPIILEQAVQSPSVQNFLKLDDWSSDRAATELVRKFQESLPTEPAPQ